MHIAHISDLHITVGGGQQGLARPDGVARARALIADLGAFRPALDLVVITGDNVNDAKPAEYDALRDVLAGLAIPFLIIPGNHDDRALLRGLVPDRAYADPHFLYHAHRQGDLRLFALDSLSEGRTGGTLERSQLDWLAAGLAEPFAGHTMVALHHPLFAPQMGVLDRNILTEGAERLAEILRGFGKPVTVLCGHMHRPFTITSGNVTLSAATSTAFQFPLDLGAPEEPAPVNDPYHYAIHILEADGSQLIHRRFPDL